MKTFKLNELKKKISKDNWGVVADYLNGTCDGDILPNILSWDFRREDLSSKHFFRRIKKNINWRWNG